MKNINRRKFLKDTINTTAALGISSQAVLAGRKNNFDSKGLATVRFGKTGVDIPRIVIGTGSRWCAVKDEEKALEILEYAVDNGFYYWDSASSYKGEGFASEERVGKLLKHRRKDVFMSTKVKSRDPEIALKEIETSLKRLQTDYFDVLQIHLIESDEDVDNIGQKGGLWNILSKLKEQGIARNIGFTGHLNAEAMAKMVKRFDFDTMLIALNHHQKGKQKFEEHAVPAAAKKGMGVLAMKVIRPRENIKNLAARDLARYALSLENVNAAVIGTDSLAVLKENIDIVKYFKPLNDSEMREMQTALAPFYRHEKLVWMQPWYQDGMIV
jgi:uncharacterized protein